MSHDVHVGLVSSPPPLYSEYKPNGNGLTIYESTSTLIYQIMKNQNRDCTVPVHVAVPGTVQNLTYFILYFCV